MEVDKSTQILTGRDSRVSALLFLSVCDFVSKHLMELRRKVDTSDLSGMKFLLPSAMANYKTFKHWSMYLVK